MQSIANKLKGYEYRNEVKKVDFTQSFPSETCLQIFSYLNAVDLARCSGLNKVCQILASDKALLKALPAPEITFGKAAWKKYFGDVGLEVPLPLDIHKILKSPCPFWPGKKVEETHMLVLIPETVDGKPLNLKTLQELVKAPKEGHGTEYRYIWDAIMNEHGETTVKSHWVLMTKDVIEGSGNKNYMEQQTLISEISKKIGITYEVPTLLDAVVCLFTRFVSSKERLFNHEPGTYTRCQERTEDYPIIVGGFSPYGLIVNVCFGSGYLGVAALRKFSQSKSYTASTS